jgi:5-methylcytosine-specific restriction protein A
MGKLTTLKPMIGSLPSRIGLATGDERQRDNQRREAQPWRNWYKTVRWEKLRREAFARDLYTCTRTGELCAGTGHAPNAPVANHKTPHKGDPSLFWDIDNIETVTKRVHDTIIQAEERRMHPRW